MKDVTLCCSYHFFEMESLQDSLDKLARSHFRENLSMLTTKQCQEIAEKVATTPVFVIIRTLCETRRVPDFLEGGMEDRYTFYETSREYHLVQRLLATYPILQQYSNWDILFPQVKQSYCYQITQDALTALGDQKAFFWKLRTNPIPPTNSLSSSTFDDIPTAKQLEEEIIDTQRQLEETQIAKIKEELRSVQAAMKKDRSKLGTFDLPWLMEDSVMDLLQKDLKSKGYSVKILEKEREVDRDRVIDYHQVSILIE